MPASVGSAQIDTYIAKAQPFAQPILAELRARVSAAVPEAEEGLKWGMPHFMYRGKILCHMAAFSRHAAFGFWHGDMVTGGMGGRMDAMGDLGKLTSVDDLPDAATFAAWMAKAKQLNDDGVKAPQVEGRGKHAKPELPMDPELTLALNEAGAMDVWGAFPPSARRDYLEWISGAKRAETRQTRIAKAALQIAEGKKLHWKYGKC